MKLRCGQTNGRETTAVWRSIEGASTHAAWEDALASQARVCIAGTEERVFLPPSRANWLLPSPTSPDCIEMGQSHHRASAPGLTSACSRGGYLRASCRRCWDAADLHLYGGCQRVAVCWRRRSCRCVLGNTGAGRRSRGWASGFSPACLRRRQWSLAVGLLVSHQRGTGLAGMTARKPRRCVNDFSLSSLGSPGERVSLLTRGQR